MNKFKIRIFKRTGNAYRKIKITKPYYWIDPKHWANKIFKKIIINNKSKLITTIYL